MNRGSLALAYWTQFGEVDRHKKALFVGRSRDQVKKTLGFLEETTQRYRQAREAQDARGPNA